MINKALVDLLVCPVCKHGLELIQAERTGLLCKHCQHVFPIKENIPVMLSKHAIAYSEWTVQNQKQYIVE